HAAVREAGKECSADRLFLVDDQTGAKLELQRARQGDAEKLLGLPFRLDQGGGHDRLACLGAPVLASEADFLGIRILTLAAALRPRGITERRQFRPSLCRSAGCPRLLGSWGWSRSTRLGRSGRLRRGWRSRLRRLGYRRVDAKARR